MLQTQATDRGDGMRLHYIGRDGDWFVAEIDWKVARWFLEECELCWIEA